MQEEDLIYPVAVLIDELRNEGKFLKGSNSIGFNDPPVVSQNGVVHFLAGLVRV